MEKNGKNKSTYRIVSRLHARIHHKLPKVKEGKERRKEGKKLTGTILTHDVKKIFFSSQVIVDWT